MIFERVLIIGLGLVGGSVLAALRRHSKNTVVYAWDCEKKAIAKAVELGLCEKDHAFATANVLSPQLFHLIQDAQLIIIATPWSAFTDVIKMLRDSGATSDKTVITDTLSIKQLVVDCVCREWPNQAHRFVGAHPIAGSEQSGILAARDDLFDGRTVALTPHADNDNTVIEDVKNWWLSLAENINVHSLDATSHDLILAHTSHLPHVLAYALMHQFMQHSDYLQLSAGSLSDMTRTANASAELWSEICIANRHHLLQALTGFNKELNRCIDLLESGDTAALRSLFGRAQALKLK